MGRQTFYLKIDKGSKLAMDNLGRWINAISLLGGDCYLLCDKDDVIQKVKDILNFSSYCHIDEWLKLIV